MIKLMELGNWLNVENGRMGEVKSNVQISGSDYEQMQMQCIHWVCKRTLNGRTSSCKDDQFSFVRVELKTQSTMQ